MLGAEIIEQILVKVNGEIFTKTDLETRQVQAMRQRGIQLDPKSDPTDAQLRQALNTVTPQVMVEAVSEMLARPARQGAGLQAGRRAVQADRRQHPQGKQARHRREVPGGAQTGKHDRRRFAPPDRALDRGPAGRIGRSLRQGRHLRGRGAPLLRRAPRGVHDAGGGHAARDSRGRAGRRRRRRARTRPPGPRPSRSAPVPRPARTT